MKGVAYARDTMADVVLELWLVMFVDADMVDDSEDPVDLVPLLAPIPTVQVSTNQAWRLFKS